MKSSGRGFVGQNPKGNGKVKGKGKGGYPKGRPKGKGKGNGSNYNHVLRNICFDSLNLYY